VNTVKDLCSLRFERPTYRHSSVSLANVISLESLVESVNFRYLL
jgi:hypothetical protein